MADPGTCQKYFFVNGIFIMLQNKYFGQNIFWISCTGSKVPFSQNLKNAKMALLNPWMKFKENQLKDFFWSIMKMPFTKNISNMSQGPPNPGFRSVRVQKWDFLKKDSQDFKISFQCGFLWIPCKTVKQNQKVLILWWFKIVEIQV